MLFFCKTKPRWDVFTWPPGLVLHHVKLLSVHLNTQWIIIFPCNLHMFLPQRSSRGHSADEWPHHCQSVRCSKRSLGQSWPGTTSSLFFLIWRKLKDCFRQTKLIIAKFDLNIHHSIPVFSKQVSNLQYEMLLLTDSISKEGGCWELRLRCGKPNFFF